MVARLDNVPCHEVVDARSTRSTTSSTAAPRAPTSARATARGSSSSSPTRSSGASPTSSCRRAGPLRRRRVLPAQRRGAPRASSSSCSSSTSASRARSVLGWRDVPIDEAHVGDTRQPPRARTSASCSSAPGRLPRRPGRLRAQALRHPPRSSSSPPGPDFYSPSFSSRTCVYKGMLISHQLRGFYPDLQDERFAIGMALVHSRFSTNTFPSWELAHPYRVIAHNGEINTLMGNVNWMRARESAARERALRPRPPEGHADRAPRRLGLRDVRQRPRAADARRPLAAARGDDDDPRGLRGPRRPPRRAQGLLRLPLVPDGAVGRPRGGRFTNGRVVGATLDRNGLRPGRWVETKDG